MAEKKIKRISVRHLVEFLLRSGDLRARKSGLADREAMQAGGRIHRKLQKRRGAAYQAEVSLRFEREYPHVTLVIEGRADGIYADEIGTVIEEIKGTYRKLEGMEKPEAVHLAQAKCYACIYAMEHALSEIRTEMTYCHLETEELRYFTERHQRDELEKWFLALCDDYSKWAEFQVCHEEKRNASMQGMEFPFTYREGQRDMVVSVYRTILHQKQLFVQAPTGVGKTMSAIFPAVRALGEQAGEKIFYLTAKTITRTVAEEAFTVLQAKGLQAKRLTITAKEKICVCEEVNCDPQNCACAKGHFDRINDAMFDLLTSENCCSREVILRYAEKWQVCPYELQLDMAEFMDAVICDYNYVFDPAARLGRFFGESARKGEYIFLIDEAHNLVERGREMFSADICRQEVTELRKCFDKKEKKLRKSCNEVNRILLEYEKVCSGTDELENIGDLIIALMNLRMHLEAYLARERDAAEREEAQESVFSMAAARESAEGALSAEDAEGIKESRAEKEKLILEFYFRLCAFLNIYELMDEHYLTYMKLRTEGDVCIRLYCVNPAGNLQYSLDRGVAAVFFSATLLPMQYYQSLLTSREENYGIYIPSPFPQENRMLAIGRDVSSKYTRRGPEEYRRIAAYIDAALRGHRGNYMVFFPSYLMLEAVYEVFEEEFLYQHADRIFLLRQEAGMREKQREEFLEMFRDPMPEASVVAFCVMGGIFAEGIDLTGAALEGVLLVGTGLPQISKERELLKLFYDRQGMNGFDYAYKLPAMNKVLQAAGRVIRTVEDQGVILLLDERFAYSEYRKLFPREWNDCGYVNVNTVEREVRNFWEQRSKEN